MSAQLRFSTSRFETASATNEATPVRSGDAMLEWLAERLTALGLVSETQVLPVGRGWCLDVEVFGEPYQLGCNNGQDENWALTVAPRRGLIDRLMGREALTTDDALLRIVVEVLERQPDFSGIELTTEAKTLPPGQRERDQFPRFGLDAFVERFPESFTTAIEVSGAISTPFVVAEEFAALPRHQQTSDFHCVTTWSVRDLNWEGVLFRDFYNACLVQPGRVTDEVHYVLLRCQDGFRAQLPLSDLLADDVLLADTLNGEPLSVAHGAPLRLVAPAHYGYKNAKHINRIEFWPDDSHFKAPALDFMVHPRGRVELEERGKIFSGRFLRWLYRPLVNSTIRKFERALADHEGKNQ